MTELVREHDAGVKNGIAVVFVHGLGAERRHAWMHDPGDAASLWPHWLGKEVGCDTWTIGYDSDLMAWRDTASSLYVHGLAIMDRLSTEPELAGRPLILLGHGVGGLLIKKAIVHAMTKGAPRHRRLVNRIHGVGLIATPQRGAELNLLSQALCARQNIPLLNIDFTAEDRQLRALHDEFSILCSGLTLQARVFAEGKPVVTGWKWLGLLKVRKMVVPHEEGSSHVTGETVLVLPEDHFSICKPQAPNFPLHRAIAAWAEACKTLQIPLEASPAPAAQEPGISPIIVLNEASTPVGLQVSASAANLPVRPALIETADDFRLQLCENKLYGRDRALTRILTFLDDDSGRAAVVAARAVDFGGLGKTELCKAALKIWIGRSTGRTAFYIDLPENAGPLEFIHLLTRGIGIGSTAGGTANFEQLKTLLPQGLYYLDNVGSLAEQDEGRQLLLAMRDLPGVRILASSRRPLQADFGQAIEVDALPKPSALALFRDLWSGSDILPADTVLAQFVDNDLQRHALSICLIARLGDFFAYDEMVRRWRQHDAEAVEDSRVGLFTSLELTAEALQGRAGALPMWALAAGFPEGVEAAELERFETAGSCAPATCDFLQHHRILEKRGDSFHLLSPLACFARDFPAIPVSQ